MPQRGEWRQGDRYSQYDGYSYQPYPDALACAGDKDRFATFAFDLFHRGTLELFLPLGDHFNPTAERIRLVNRSRQYR